MNALRGFVLALALAIAVAVPAVAQYSAPAGNEHPRAAELSGTASDNPFGPPAKVETSEAANSDEAIRAKHAFAEALRQSKALEPLADLAVSHDGRVKIIDTLAHDSVRTIAGRRDYFDVIATRTGEKIRVEKFTYDPLFTWLDLLINPASYGGKPLIAVDFLPLRDRFLEAAFPQDEALREKYRKITRVPPSIAARFFKDIANKYGTEEGYGSGLNKVQNALSLIEHGEQNLVLLAPAQPDLPYANVGTLSPEHPVRVAMLAMGTAWRAKDAAGVKAAAATLAAELPKINAATYPTTKRGLELAYNRVNAFEWGYWAYFFSLVSLIIAFGTQRRTLVGIGIAMLVVAIALHGFGFTARSIIAERFAIQNQFESMTGLSLFGALVGLGIMIKTRQWLFGAAAAGVGFLVLITATQTNMPGQQIGREAAILNTSVLLKYHVTTVLASYGLITLGMIVSLFYLGVHYLNAAKSGKGTLMVASAPASAGMETALNLDDNAPAGVRRTLSDLDKAQMTALQLAFWTLGVGILLGAWWADHSWGRWWAFDPKETWALITWIVYLIAIHTRFTGVKNKGLVTAWLSVIGFIVMLWCYFGVNLLLPGLHAYA